MRGRRIEYEIEFVSAILASVVVLCQLLYYLWSHSCFVACIIVL